MDNLRLKLLAVLCVVCFCAAFASLGQAQTTEMWLGGANPGTISAATYAANTKKDTSPVQAILKDCLTYGGGTGHHTGSLAFQSVFSANDKINGICYNAGNGALGNPIASRFYNCPAAGASWFSTLPGACAAPTDPCISAPYAGQLATPADSYFDMGTDPDKLTGSQMMGCQVGGSGGAAGCLAVFEGEFPSASGMVDGVKHYYAKGAYRYLPASSGAKCHIDSLADGAAAKPAESCKAGDIKSTVNGVTACNKPDGTPTDTNDENNDGMPDSCHPGSWTTSDGWAVTESWNAGTRTCNQTGTKSGQPTQNNNITPGSPGPFQNPTPGPGQPTQQPGTTDPKKTGDEMSEFCKKNPETVMCKKQTFSGTCAAGYSCTGDAVFCAMAKDQHSRNCSLFDTATALSTLGSQVTSGADPEQAAIDAAMGKGATPTDMSSVLVPGSEPLAAGCPEMPSVSVMGQSITMSSAPYCDAAGYMGLIFVAFSLLVGANIIIRGF